ncbi:hypothetical protein KKB18_04345, partial [bacterium]|nr:hypothetical protein [bacterium]
VFSGEYAEYLKDENMMHLYGNPKVWLKDNTITGNDIYYYISKDQYMVEGNVSTLLFLSDRKGKSDIQKDDTNHNRDFKGDTVLITSDTLLFNGQEQYAEYIGNVKIESEDMELIAKTVKIFMNKDDSELARILAQDEVRIQSGEFVGIGDNALYIDKTNKIILSGSPKIYQSDKIISSGKEVTFLINQKKVQIDSEKDDRVKTTLFIKTDEGFLGFDKKTDEEKNTH